MAYYRPAKRNELTAWLLASEAVELTEEQAQELAAALIDAYEVIGPFKSPV